MQSKNLSVHGFLILGFPGEFEQCGSIACRDQTCIHFHSLVLAVYRVRVDFQGFIHHLPDKFLLLFVVSECLADDFLRYIH